MNEPGKSDKPIVPRKPANSGESLNFWEFIEQLEQVEGRGLAKENEDQAGKEAGLVFHAGPAKQTDRTQGGEKVTSINSVMQGVVHHATAIQRSRRWPSGSPAGDQVWPAAIAADRGDAQAAANAKS